MPLLKVPAENHSLLTPTNCSSTQPLDGLPLTHPGMVSFPPRKKKCCRDNCVGITGLGKCCKCLLNRNLPRRFASRTMESVRCYLFSTPERMVVTYGH